MGRHWTEQDFLSCSGSTSFARAMAAAAPFPDLSAAVRSARSIWFDKVDVNGWLQSFNSHPAIGSTSTSISQWSKEEQSAAQATATESMMQELIEWNARYKEKFGFVFLICASGRGTPEILAELKKHYANRPSVELEKAAQEEMKIIELRLARLFEGEAGASHSATTQLHVIRPIKAAGIDPFSQDERGPGKNKRKWTEIEDEKLIEALMDLVNAGTHKADNGFKPGYATIIENALKKKLPGFGIKAKPHIESRLKTMKKDFNTVHDMLHGPFSGDFNWDPDRKCVFAEPSVWDAYVRVHKNAVQWKNRPFPHYGELCAIFGKDKATWKGAQTVANVVEELEQEDEELANEDRAYRFDELNANNPFMPYFSTSLTPTPNPSTPSEECTSRRLLKRRRSLDPVLECISNATNMIGNHLQKVTDRISEAISVDLEVTKKKKELNATLKNVSVFQMRRRVTGWRLCLGGKYDVEMMAVIPLLLDTIMPSNQRSRPPITTHVLDVSRGSPAAGIEVHLEMWKGTNQYPSFEERDSGEWVLQGSSVTNSDGRSGPLMGIVDYVTPGIYRISFNSGKYQPSGFFPYVSIVFEIKESQSTEHFHVPLLLSPFSFSTYRGS